MPIHSIILFYFISLINSFSQYAKVLEREWNKDSVCILRNDVLFNKHGDIPPKCRCDFSKLSSYEYECSRGENGDVDHRICRDRPCQVCCKLLLDKGITNEPAILCQKRCFGSSEIENVTEAVKGEIAIRLWEFTSLFKGVTKANEPNYSTSTEYNDIAYDARDAKALNYVL